MADATKKANTSLKSHIEQKIKRSSNLVVLEKRQLENAEIVATKKKAKDCAAAMKSEAAETCPLFKIGVPAIIEAKTIIEIPVFIGLQLARGTCRRTNQHPPRRQAITLNKHRIYTFQEP